MTVPSLTLPAVLAALEQLHYEISTESRLVRVGLKTEQQIEPILKRYAWLGTRETLEFLRQARDAAFTAEARERLERAWFACLGDYVYRAIAPLDDRLHTELARTEVTIRRERIAYHNLQPRLQKEPDFETREELGAALDSVHLSFQPLRLEMIETDLGVLTGELRFSSYIDYCQQKKQFEYAGFAESLLASLRRTEPLYRKHVGRWCEEKLRRPYGGLNRCHISHLMHLADFDAHFPAAPMLPRLLGTLRDMGIDLEAMPQIRLDLAERDRKNPRACCYAARVPEEIHLILKPVGGLTDYDTFLHEAGHALHYGRTDGSLPYEYRKLGRSYALSEIYAFTLQNVVMDLDWLQSAMGIPGSTARQIRYFMILRDLYMFRRYCAKLVAEHEFFQRGRWTDGAIYARALTEATGFVHRDVNYLFDMDGEFYSADYLRAWIGEAQLANHFDREYGSGWAADPRVGSFLNGLWRQGEKPSAEQVIASIGQKPLDLSCLEKRFDELEAL